ncbi:hypothetical protein B7P43_G06499 [Cryptotermes secundus]|uniref:Uncharacterized protein n=1 Tax=Cryptotermes secundus TaxID=105785 RepID=A0A2J7R609_9NEOP|nr:hypothetical protein B7P43_G06499 [Cryptotermes secundus]
MNVHAPTEDKIDDIKDRFYEEVEHVFDKFPTYPIKILLEDFNAKVGREDIFKPTIWNESLHEISNDNGVRVVNFATSKNLTVKSTMFPHRNIHNFTWTSPDGKIHNEIDHISIDRRRHSSILDVRSFRAADCDTDHYLVAADVRERLAVSNILLSRLSLYINENVGDHQCGFRRNRSTTDQMFCIPQILEKKWEYVEAVHQQFIDFKKPCDSVRREVLYNILIEFGIPIKLVRLIKMFLNETYSKVRIGKHLSDNVVF